MRLGGAWLVLAEGKEDRCIRDKVGKASLLTGFGDKGPGLDIGMGANFQA